MSSSQAPPNVVLILVDQLAAKWLEVALAGAAPLPNLAWLRDNGTTFPNTFTPNPVCSPARASLATGLPAATHGVVECGYRLDPSIPTFMGQLQQAGWRTSVHGKLHLQPDLETYDPDCHVYGFDHTDITEDVRIGNWLDWVRTEHPEHYRAACATVWMTMHPALYTAEGAALRDEIETAQRDWSWTTEDRPWDTPEAYVLPFPAQVSQSTWITDRFLDFLDELPDGQPFFSQIGYVQPHNPFCAPEALLGEVDESAIPEPVPAEWRRDPHAPHAIREDHGPTGDYDDIARNARLIYFADLVHLDHEIGRVRQALVDAGRLDNTYVVFTSDHGELLYDHGLLGKWQRHYDACIRVPLVVAGPDVATGATDDRLAELTDLAPTILEWCDVDPPGVPTFDRSGCRVTHEPSPLHGRSLAGDATTTGRAAVLIESYGSHWTNDLSGFARTLRTSSHRYTLYGDGGQQLFDLRADPDEQHNLVGDESSREILEDLRHSLTLALIARDRPPRLQSLFARGSW
ncbi:sulfatase-like hydrolase/transferase [Nocardioides sp. LMS-CY]|uniref:sulfatase family protein n=1 Tax=Nocardioides sp. (strain LMS-CY) TaxID=2840457 RepID=UPI001C0064F5|nr:sulfatase-like hydrolase/transferase [Nocardioides sp. LMS-CY]QWF20796.1 sulfatase-like hydrolase/transferase [Nocardioides sp. LMS-CY]